MSPSWKIWWITISHIKWATSLALATFCWAYLFLLSSLWSAIVFLLFLSSDDALVLLAWLPAHLCSIGPCLIYHSDPASVSSTSASVRTLPQYCCCLESSLVLTTMFTFLVIRETFPISNPACTESVSWWCCLLPYWYKMLMGAQKNERSSVYHQESVFPSRVRRSGDG